MDPIILGLMGPGFLNQVPLRHKVLLERRILGGSGDLASRVISKVTILISTYNRN